MCLSYRSFRFWLTSFDSQFLGWMSRGKWLFVATSCFAFLLMTDLCASFNALLLPGTCFEGESTYGAGGLGAPCLPLPGVWNCKGVGRGVAGRFLSGRRSGGGWGARGRPPVIPRAPPGP